MKEILCIGHASYDITIPFDGYPKENTKNRVTDKVECGGGPASNAAYLLGKWGMATTFIGVLGNDHHGTRIKKEFENVNVNTDYVETDYSNDTTLSFVLVNKQNGSRTTFAYRSPDMRLRNKIEVKADVILLDGQELRASLEALEYNPHAISILDAGRLKDENIQLGQKVTYLVCSKNFAEDFTNMKIDVDNKPNLIDVYNIMEKTFKNNIIITLEDKGCLYKKNNIIYQIPSIKVTAVDSTGAGDIFHGAFTYCIANDFDLEKSLKISNITGALSVTKMGGRNSIFSFNEVLKEYEKLVQIDN
ncbi:MAG: carbohydrate kinase family protein [Bacilli bacterium]|nr:carbohydrate kinase family protein [Bacilli bacterium]